MAECCYGANAKGEFPPLDRVRNSASGLCAHLGTNMDPRLLAASQATTPTPKVAPSSSTSKARICLRLAFGDLLMVKLMEWAQVRVPTTVRDKLLLRPARKLDKDRSGKMINVRNCLRQCGDGAFKGWRRKRLIVFSRHGRKLLQWLLSALAANNFSLLSAASKEQS